MSGQPPAPVHSFDDVTTAEQHQAVAWMAAEGITTGTTPTTFSPDRTLTRGETAAFLHRLAGQPAMSNSGFVYSFVDVVKDWQYQAVAWMAASEITTGTSATTFSPDDALTRAQLVTFLYRYQNEPAVTIDTDSPKCGPTQSDTTPTTNATTSTDADGQTDALNPTDLVPAMFKHIAAGLGHSCGIRTDDTITCWGSSTNGRTDPPAGAFKQIAASSNGSCAIRTDDTISCWGDVHDEPPVGTFKAIDRYGTGHNCAIRTDDTIECWDRFGRLLRAPAREFKATSGQCGIRSDDTITCWRNAPDRTDPPAGTFKQIAAGRDHTCAIRSDDTVTCWHRSRFINPHQDYGQTDPPAGSFKQIAAGTDYTCAIRTDDTLACWGRDLYGEGWTDPPAGSFKQIAAGIYHTCAIRTDNAVACWGSNRFGQTDPP